MFKQMSKAFVVGVNTISRSIFSVYYRQLIICPAQNTLFHIVNAGKSFVAQFFRHPVASHTYGAVDENRPVFRDLIHDAFLKTNGSLQMTHIELLWSAGIKNKGLMAQ